MRKKFRIFSTITSMVLVIVMLCIGIWAATSVTLSGGNSLTVGAGDDVLAKVELKNVAGSSIVTEASWEYNTYDGTAKTESMTLPALVFTSDVKSYSFELVVTNLFADSSQVQAALTTSLTGTNASSFEITTSSTENIEASDSHTFAIVISLNDDVDFTQALSADYSVQLVLTKVQSIV